jgi:hypothetical protein
LNKNTFDYHLIFDGSKKVDLGGVEMELGLKLEFMMMPANYKYTISETPYLGETTINSFSVKQNFPAWGIGVVSRIILFNNKKDRIKRRKKMR